MFPATTGLGLETLRGGTSRQGKLDHKLHSLRALNKNTLPIFLGKLQALLLQQAHPSTAKLEDTDPEAVSSLFFSASFSPSLFESRQNIDPLNKNYASYIFGRIAGSTSTAGSSVDLLTWENTDPEAVFSLLFFARFPTTSPSIRSRPHNHPLSIIILHP